VVVVVNIGYRDTENKNKFLERDVGGMKDMKSDNKTVSRKISISGTTLCKD
jgi:hypothetical protein